ncbi:MAG: hypothetical protein BWX72_00631 [Firmicutes bacterium ADurb.Bin080]|jgi:uncharacterized protein YrzB (UPF0473 family)|nr:DUF1292 domain-containing protein [Clostridiales bacterium]OQC16496.1 MAG: hypothetical protein BWX72_00631 [Firmicutes bacterium ADurb.Bin080]
MENLNNMEEVIVLVGDKGDEHEFREIALVEYNQRTFICLEPAEEIEGFEDGDLLIYELSYDENDEEIFLPIDDENLLKEVFDQFLSMQNENK